MIPLNHLSQSLAKITHKTAANATGIHFGNINPRILQKAAINADLAKLVLNEHQFLCRIAFLDHFLNQRSLARSQESGINIDFRHRYTLCIVFLLL